MPAALISIKPQPRRLRTVETFEAADPWNGGVPAVFDLDLHRMVPRVARLVRAGASWGKDVHALRSKLDGADRFLPESLAELWKSGRVPAASLPRLLFELAPDLRQGDFTPLLHTRAHRWKAAFFALVALGFLVMAVWASGAARGRKSSRLSLAEWLARPQVEGEDFVTERPVKIEGMVKLSFEPILPPALFAYPANGEFVLAWFPASGGRRLLLAAADQVPALPDLTLTGVTLTPESISLPPPELHALSTRVPGLDTSLVTALNWTWTDIRTTNWRAGRRSGALALMSGAGAVILYAMVALPQARRRRQMAWALART